MSFGTEHLHKEIRDWEKFWSWLLMSASGESVYWSDTTLMHWLQAKWEEYHTSCQSPNKVNEK